MWVKKPSPLADDLHLLKRERAKRVIVDSEVRGTTLKKLIVKWKWKKVKVKVKVKVIHFWSFIFFIFRYVKGEVLGNHKISIQNCRTTLYGSKTLHKLGVAPTIFKIWLLRWLFLNMVYNFSVLGGTFETKFHGRFLFSQKFRGISFVQLRWVKIILKGFFI